MKKKLYTKTSKGVINFWEIWTNGATVYTRWGAQGGKVLSDSYVAEGKNVGKANETSPADQAVLEATSKVEAKKRVKYFDTIKAATNTMNIKPMLAAKLDEKREKKLVFPVTVQPKLNGVRCLAYNLPDGTVRLMSRGGKDYTLPHISDELKGKIPAGVALDGEIYAHGFSLQVLRQFIDTPQKGTAKLKLHCYDMTSLPPDGKTWPERYAQLHKFWSSHALVNSTLLKSPQVKSMEDVNSKHNMFVSQGYEGLILRGHDNLYKLGARSTSLLKMKSFEDAEFPIMSHSVAKDGVPTFRCVTPEGNEFDVRPKGSMEERKAMLKNVTKLIGQLLTVRYQELSDDLIPIFPVGIAFRDARDL